MSTSEARQSCGCPTCYAGVECRITQGLQAEVERLTQERDALRAGSTCSAEPRWVVVVEEHDQAGPFVASVIGPFRTEQKADERCLAIVKARGLGCAPNTHELRSAEHGH